MEEREEHTFHELSVLFGELLVLVGLDEAVVPQATCVRQTLNHCVEETLIGNKAQGKLSMVA